MQIMQTALEVAKQAATKAGRVLVTAQKELVNIQVHAKQRNDLVTQFDVESETIIVEHIKQHFPTHSILAEESGLNSNNKDYCWIIDPIDGTTNFARGLPHFAISIALEAKNGDGLGLIYDPIREEMFSAIRNKGAFVNGQPIHISDQHQIEGAFLATGFPCKVTAWVAPYMQSFATIFPMSLGIRRAGAASLDLAYLAAGRYDGFWEFDLKHWDIAAAKIIIEEAGGTLIDLMGQTNAPDDGVIAGSQDLCHALAKIISPIWAPYSSANRHVANTN